MSVDLNKTVDLIIRDDRFDRSVDIAHLFIGSKPSFILGDLTLDFVRILHNVYHQGLKHELEVNQVDSPMCILSRHLNIFRGSLLVAGIASQKDFTREAIESDSRVELVQEVLSHNDLHDLQSTFRILKLAKQAEDKAPSSDFKISDKPQLRTAGLISDMINVAINWPTKDIVENMGFMTELFGLRQIVKSQLEQILENQETIVAKFEIDSDGDDLLEAW